MKKHIPFCFIFLCLTAKIFAQSTSAMQASTWDRLNNPEFDVRKTIHYGTFFGVAPPKGNIKGTHYYDTLYADCKFVVYNDEEIYGGVKARIDLLNTGIEFKTEEGIKFMEGKKMKYFSLNFTDKYTLKTFINSAEFKSEEEIKGFFEMLSYGKLSLLEHTKLWIKEPTYIPSFDVGTRDTQLIHTRQYYYVSDKKVFKFNPNKKNLLKIMQDKSVEMEAFLKKNQPNLKDAKELKAIFDYYNGLK